MHRTHQLAISDQPPAIAPMRYELFIGWRYLRAKRKEAFISLIT